MRYTVIYHQTGTFVVNAKDYKEAVEKAERQKPDKAAIREIIPIKSKHLG